MYKKISSNIVDKLISIVGPANVITDNGILENYAHDETPFYYAMPELVLKPANTNEISAILKLADENHIPVTARGGGTSLSAGAVPLHHGIVLSLEKMNQVIDVDQENLMAVVEPGIITGIMAKELARYNLFFPPDPVSMDSCTIGGNIAECAGGPRAMKYGVTKNYITGLEVVFANGKIQRLGGKLLKNVSGYDLIDLIVGSEGTLAVVSQATIKLLTIPDIVVDLYIPFNTVPAASKFSIEVLRQGFMPSAIELMDGDVVRLVEKYLCRDVPYSTADAHIILELDGNDTSYIKRIYEKIGDLALRMGALDVLVAESLNDRARIWEIRKKIGEALKAHTTIVAREDLVVPKNCIPALIGKLKDCVKKYHGDLYAFGHLGDGNIHTDVGIANQDREKNSKENILKMRREMYQITVNLGGTITAEHGIGLSKVSFLPLALDRPLIELMAKIKKEFDPNNILNPGKIFDESALTFTQ
ncbi:MAG: FAD-binding oxidoreductase [bacterium]